MSIIDGTATANCCMKGQSYFNLDGESGDSLPDFRLAMPGGGSVW
jgi:hypothetical protein